MKQKPIETPDEMLEHLREHIHELINSNKDGLMDHICESTEYERGVYRGYDLAMDEFDQYMRSLCKYGYEHLKINDWDVMVSVEGCGG